MGKIEYKYIDPPRNTEKAIDFMKNVMLPMLREYWEAEGKNIYEAEMSFNILTFIQMWNMGSLLIIIAYEDSKPVGFFIGVRFTPLLFDAAAVQVEIYYAHSKEIEDGIFDYLMKIVGFMNLNEIWLSKDPGQNPHIPWTKKNSFTVTRYVKE